MQSRPLLFFFPTRSHPPNYPSKAIKGYLLSEERKRERERDRDGCLVDAFPNCMSFRSIVEFSGLYLVLLQRPCENAACFSQELSDDRDRHASETRRFSPVTSARASSNEAVFLHVYGAMIHTSYFQQPNASNATCSVQKSGIAHNLS